MDRHRWEQIKSVFEEAQELKPDSRASFLTQACGDDAALRSEVEALLDHDRRAGSFLDGTLPPRSALRWLARAISPSHRVKSSRDVSGLFNSWAAAEWAMCMKPRISNWTAW